MNFCDYCYKFTNKECSCGAELKLNLVVNQTPVVKEDKPVKRCLACFFFDCRCKKGLESK